MREAVRVSGAADLTVVVAGIEEGEFRDRSSLSLPGRQEELIRRIAAGGKPVVVVLVGGSAVTMSSWIDDVDAIVDAWYPGEVGGVAVAEVLFGDYSPAGRLPITFPESVGQVPLYYNHKPTGRGDDYMDLSGKPLFPFGYGLSYTTFAYSNLVIASPEIRPDGSTKVGFTVKNTGTVAGDEVVQLYVRDLVATTTRPVMELKGFRRVSLRPGESAQVWFDIGPAALSMLDANMMRVVEPGDFKHMVGSSSRDIRLRGFVKVVAHEAFSSSPICAAALSCCPPGPASQVIVLSEFIADQLHAAMPCLDNCGGRWKAGFSLVRRDHEGAADVGYGFQ
jgi:beta-glucosidase